MCLKRYQKLTIIESPTVTVLHLLQNLVHLLNHWVRPWNRFGSQCSLLTLWNSNILHRLVVIINQSIFAVIVVKLFKPIFMFFDGVAVRIDMIGTLVLIISSASDVVVRFLNNIALLNIVSWVLNVPIS